MNGHGLAANDAAIAARGAAAGAGPDQSRLDERRLRAAFGRFATGVVVISTGCGSDLHAMTANAFMSGSLAPPLIVVAIGHRARMHDRLMQADRFGVSILSDDQERHSRHFAGEPQNAFAPRFTGVDGLDGVVLLEHAVARFGLRVADRHLCGDHTLFVGEVLAFSLDECSPLVFFSGRYASVAGRG